MPTNENAPRDAGDCSPEELAALSAAGIKFLETGDRLAFRKTRWAVDTVIRDPASPGATAKPYRLNEIYVVGTEEELVTALLNGHVVYDEKGEVPMDRLAEIMGRGKVLASKGEADRS